MIRHSLARLCRRLASWLELAIERAPQIEEAIRRADDARAIRMEFERQMRRPARFDRVERAQAIHSGRR